MDDYFDLDNKPKKKKKKEKPEKTEKPEKPEKTTKIQVTQKKKLIITVILWLICMFTLFIKFNSVEVDDTPEKSVIEYRTVETRNNKFKYTTEHIDLEKGKGYIGDAEVKFNCIDIENNGLEDYLKFLQRRIIQTDDISVDKNDYIEQDDKKQVYQMKYYYDKYAIIDTYWWQTSDIIREIYCLSINIAYENKEDINNYDNDISKIIETIEFD